MTNKLTLTEQEELFAKDCKLINLKYEYNGYTGDEKWAIITELSVKELWEKYPLVIERYSPFVHLSIAQGEVIDDANRNEDKYAKRSSRSSGEKCPICSGARVIEGINDLNTLKPELASEWSEENEIKPTEVSIGSHKKAMWKCKLGHEWIATVKSRTINRTGCPYCSHNKVLAGFNDLATVLPEVAAEERIEKQHF